MNAITSLFLIALLAAGLPAAQAGVLAGGTRVIYDEGLRERSLMLANTNPYPVVVQTWVDGGGGAPESAQAPFIVLPAVFRMQPGGLQGLRIIHIGEALPRDRESVFWLNLYEIPPLAGRKEPDPARVELAMNTQLKLFYRPAKLPLPPGQVAGKLTFDLRREGDAWFLVCRNPTPYHASFTTLGLSGDGRTLAAQQQMDMMTPPFSEKRYQLEEGALPNGARVSFRLVDDTGFPIPGEAPLAH
ncbi:molecular chaperone [Pseudomonas citronellolis]|uniref:Molecular chaperone n=1 Tax=Pseudomonas citronellolis TaxID=53408 RepID=A0AAW6PEV2_9PSED|nr:molecular chaperone [Pseudomonas citronellolis]MDF3845716.1 molecular chaperone [Pseudomonas citronellolis]